MRTIKITCLLVLTFIFTASLLANLSFAGAANPVKKMIAGGGRSLILLQDGTLVIRGGGFLEHYDKLGFGVLSNGNSNWKDITASGSAIYGIKNDGTMWASGFNDVGQLGTGDTASGQKMRQIGKNKKWKMVTSEYAHAAAIAEDGSLWAWGLNGGGQIGDGTLTNRHVPTRVGTATDWLEVHTGTWNTVAVRRDGSLWAWGNTWASIINAEYAAKGKKAVTKPLKIVDKLNYKKMSVGSQDTMFIKKDGTLWGWGYDYKRSAYNLTRISNEKWKDVVVGSSEFGRPSYAIKEDGTLWTIAKQSMEKKQGGVTRSVLSGVEIKSISPDHDWKALADQPDSSNNMIFMKENGKLYGLGFNSSGELDEPRTNKPFKELSVITELTAINKYYIQGK